MNLRFQNERLVEVSRTQEELPARRPWRNIRMRGMDILGSLVDGSKTVEDNRIDEIRAGLGGCGARSDLHWG